MPYLLIFLLLVPLFELDNQAPLVGLHVVGLLNGLLVSLQVPGLVLLRNHFIGSLLAVFPGRLLHLSIRKNIDSLVVLLPVGPGPDVHSPVGPSVDSPPVLVVIDVGPVVHPAVLPLVGSVPVLLVVLPETAVDLAVSPLADSLSVHLVVPPVPNVALSIWPRIHSKSILLVLVEETRERTAIGPGLNTVPLLGLIDPFSFVGEAIHLVEFSISVRLVVYPVTYLKDTS